MTINTKTSEEKAHSEFGGSQAERIMNCPGSVILSRGIPNKTNKASERGTAAHACLEFLVNNRDKLKKPSTRKKVLKAAEEGFTMGEADGEVIHWDEGMIANALHAVAWVEKQLQPGSEVFVETKVESTKFTTKDKKNRQKSTLDIGIANYAARELIIADFKNGTHPVEVKKNSQLIYYALAMLIKLKGWKKFDRIRLVIIQPNAHHKDGGIREWYLSVDDAIKWGKRFRKKVKLALKPKAPLKIGDKWCFFCLAKKKCPAMKARMAAKDFA
jgi:hypothetical protein